MVLRLKRTTFLLLFFCVFTVIAFAQPANDDKANAIDLTDSINTCTGYVFTNENATADGDQPSCWINAPQRNVWFKFTAPKETIEIQVGESDPLDGDNLRYARIALYDEDLNLLDCMEMTNGGRGVPAMAQAMDLTLGQLYYFSVDCQYPGSNIGKFKVCIRDSIMHYNAKEAAFDVTDSINTCTGYVFSTSGANGDGEKPDCWVNEPQHNVWFKFTAPGNSIEIQAGESAPLESGNLRYARIALYDAEMNILDCMESAYGSGRGIAAMAQYGNLIPGNLYFFTVDCREDLKNNGKFKLCIRDVITHYNSKEAAVDMTDSMNSCTGYVFNTIGANGDGNKPDCWVNKPQRNVWFKFTASTTKIEILAGESDPLEAENLRRARMALYDFNMNLVACTENVVEERGTAALIQSMELIPGEIYFFTVDCKEFEKEHGKFKVCIHNEITHYDNKEAAVDMTDSINNCTGFVFSNAGASGDGDQPSCWKTAPQHNVWFKFTAPGTDIEIEAGSPDLSYHLRYARIALYDASFNELNCMGSVQGAREAQALIQYMNLTPGNVYYFTVDNWHDDRHVGKFKVCMRDEITHYNAKEAAVDMTDSINNCTGFVFSNAGANGDGDQPSCWKTVPQHNVWFKFTAPGTDIEIEAGSPDLSYHLRYARIALYDTSFNELNCMGSVQGAREAQALIQYMDLTPGNVYYFTVDNWHDDRHVGKFKVCMRDEITNYNSKHAALDLTDSIDNCTGYIFSNSSANGDGSQPSCWKTAPQHNVWFKFTAPLNGIELEAGAPDLGGNLRYARMALFDSTFSELACVSSQSNRSLPAIINYDQLSAGSVYYFSVDNWHDDRHVGKFRVCLTSFNKSGITLNFQELTAAIFTINAPGITEVKDTSGAAGEVITVTPTAPAEGSTDSILIHVLENTNNAGNNAAMDLKVNYDHNLDIQQVMLVDGLEEQALSPTFYEVTEGKNIVFKQGAEKKALFPITTNLQGVVYNELEGKFTITLADPNLFTIKKLRLVKDGSPIIEDDTVPLEWVPQNTPASGLYHFELDLQPNLGDLQTFKGQFVVKE